MADQLYAFLEADIARIAAAVRAYERDPRNRETRQRINSRAARVTPAVVMGYLQEDLVPLGCADIQLWKPGTGVATCVKPTYDDSDSDDYPDDHLPPNYPDISDYDYATVISPDASICGTKGDLIAAFSMGLGDPDETLSLWVAFWTPCVGACATSSGSGSGATGGSGGSGGGGGGGGGGDPLPGGDGCGAPTANCRVRWTLSGWCKVTDNCGGSCTCYYDAPNPGVVGYEVDIGCTTPGGPTLPFCGGGPA